MNDTSTSTALVVAPSSSIAMVMTPSEAEARLAQLQDFVKRNMVKDVDYGVIPGTPKPSLLQPGAQKLAEIYGFATDFSDVRPPVEDWSRDAFFAYFKRCIVTRRTDGLFMGAGVGQCNSGETKYLRKSPHDIANTIEKMACKRALVMAMISVTRSAGLFTQDAEDMPHDEGAPKAPPRAPARSAPVAGDAAMLARWEAGEGTDDDERRMAAHADPRIRAKVFDWRIYSAQDPAALALVVADIKRDQHVEMRTAMLAEAERRGLAFPDGGT